MSESQESSFPSFEPSKEALKEALEPEKVEAKKEEEKILQPFTEGNFVTIKRTSGQIENDWVVSKEVNEKGEVIVTKVDPKRGPMDKRYPVEGPEGLKELNPETDFSMFSEHFLIAKTSEVKESILVFEKIRKNNLSKLELAGKDLSEDEKSKILNEVANNSEIIGGFKNRLEDLNAKREAIKEQDEEIEDRIEECKTFDELTEFLDSVQGLESSKYFESSKYWQDTIKKVREGKYSLDFITSRYGLRKKVRELLEAEKEK